MSCFLRFRKYLYSKQPRHPGLFCSLLADFMLTTHEQTLNLFIFIWSKIATNLNNGFESSFLIFRGVQPQIWTWTCTPQKRRWLRACWTWPCSWLTSHTWRPSSSRELGTGTRCCWSIIVPAVVCRPFMMNNLLLCPPPQVLHRSADTHLLLPGPPDSGGDPHHHHRWGGCTLLYQPPMH